MSHGDFPVRANDWSDCQERDVELRVSPQRAKLARYQLYSFLSAIRYCLGNPAEKIPRAILDDSAPGILTIEQVAELLKVTREEDPGVKGRKPKPVRAVSSPFPRPWQNGLHLHRNRRVPHRVGTKTFAASDSRTCSLELRRSATFETRRHSSGQSLLDQVEVDAQVLGA